MPVILSGPLGGVQGPGPPLLLSAGPVLLILPALLILAPQLTKGEIIATNLTARPDFQGSEPKIGLKQIKKESWAKLVTREVKRALEIITEAIWRSEVQTPG